MNIARNRWFPSHSRVPDYWGNFWCSGLRGGVLIQGKWDLLRYEGCVLKAVFQKYVLPHLRPPSATAYEADRDALTAQFDAAEALLQELQAESKAVRFAVEEQKERIDLTVQEVESVVKVMREGESKTRDEMREVREEVQHIREMFPKVCILISAERIMANRAMKDAG